MVCSSLKWSDLKWKKKYFENYIFPKLSRNWFYFHYLFVYLQRCPTCKSVSHNLEERCRRKGSCILFLLSQLKIFPFLCSIHQCLFIEIKYWRKYNLVALIIVPYCRYNLLSQPLYLLLSGLFTDLFLKCFKQVLWMCLKANCLEVHVHNVCQKIVSFPGCFLYYIIFILDLSL